jgi:hypothetical protein
MEVATSYLPLLDMPRGKEGEESEDRNGGWFPFFLIVLSLKKLR